MRLDSVEPLNGRDCDEEDEDHNFDLLDPHSSGRRGRGINGHIMKHDPDDGISLMPNATMIINDNAQED